MSKISMVYRSLGLFGLKTSIDLDCVVLKRGMVFKGTTTKDNSTVVSTSNDQRQRSNLICHSS